MKLSKNITLEDHYLQMMHSNSYNPSPKRTLYLVQFDIRKAFDSVSKSSLLASLNAIGILKELIQLIDTMLTGRTVRVLTKYGLTPEYNPTMGVEQGDTLSPTLWRIFYNALILAIEETKASIKLDADSHYNERTGCIDPVMVSQVVMADDLTLLTDSREKLLKLINVVDEFMCLHNIRVNGSKTVVAIQKDTLTREDEQPIYLQSRQMYAPRM